MLDLPMALVAFHGLIDIIGLRKKGMLIRIGTSIIS